MNAKAFILCRGEIMINDTLQFAKQILRIDSPSGFCHEVIDFVEKEAKSLGHETTKTIKGNLLIHVKGQSDKTIGMCAHVDTLGLMVRSINADGTLSFTNVGGPIIPTLDGEYCRIITRVGKIYTGTILSNSPAAHVFDDASSAARKCETMHIRIDEQTKSKADSEALGICNGDYIAIDPKTTITESGFIKSRFLDDKLSVAIILGVLKEMKEKNITPKDNITIIISTYE